MLLINNIHIQKLLLHLVNHLGLRASGRMMLMLMLMKTIIIIQGAQLHMPISSNHNTKEKL